MKQRTRIRTAGRLLLLAATMASLTAGARMGAEAAPATAPPQPPQLRLSGSVSPVRYAADLTLIPSAATFAGAIAIDLELAQPTSLLWLNGTGLKIVDASLTVAGTKIAAQAVAGGDDFVGFAFVRQAPKGPARLEIRYTGEISAIETRGLFRQQEGGDWYLFSQFEAYDARRAFPCFDEPSYKVPWTLTLHVKRGHSAVANTPILSESDEANGMKKVSFTPTKPLPSYLIAVGVGPFDFLDAGTAGKNHTAIRIVTAKGRAKEAWYAAQTSGAVLELLERYTGIPYPYEKLDNLIVPQTVGFGAMENAGLITWASSLVMVKPEDATLTFKRRYVSSFAHEAAHQWVGDLVTMAWWDDVWLNESFASWLGDKVTDQYQPEWGGAIDHVVERTQAADADTLISARQIRQPIESNHDIDNAFDGITYRKGEAVLQMFESWLGQEKFRQGLHHYLVRHAFGNATAEDFVGSLVDESGPEVGPAFFSFLMQPGIPEVTLDLLCDHQRPRLMLSQKRFLPLGSKGSAKQLWKVPVCVRTANQAAAADRSCVLLAAETAELPLAGGSCPAWVLGNAGGLGYYRIHYGGSLQGKLLADGTKGLTQPERVGALSDAAALVETGDLPMRDALALVPVYAGDPNRQLVQTTIAIATRIRDHLVPDQLRPNYARFLEKVYGERAHALGFTPHAGESEDTVLLRDELVGFVAESADDAALLREATELAHKWLADHHSVSPETASTVLPLAALHGDQALFDLFHAAARKRQDRRERVMLLSALGSFLDPAIAAQAMAILLTDEFDAREARVIFVAGSRRAPLPQMRYDFIKRNFDALAAKLPRDAPAAFPVLGRSFCDEEHRADVEGFFKGRIANYSGGPRTLANTLEDITLCSAFRSAQQAGVEEFLKGY